MSFFSKMKPLVFVKRVITPPKPIRSEIVGLVEDLAHDLPKTTRDKLLDIIMQSLAGKPVNLQSALEMAAGAFRKDIGRKLAQAVTERIQPKEVTEVSVPMKAALRRALWYALWSGLAAALQFLSVQLPGVDELAKNPAFIPIVAVILASASKFVTEQKRQYEADGQQPQ